MINTRVPIKYAQLSLCDVQQLDVYINLVNVDNSAIYQAWKHTQQMACRRFDGFVAKSPYHELREL